jgi:hypothetical protein
MRQFAWRTHRARGGHLLDGRFPTPEAAGEWRAAMHGDSMVPLTLVAIRDDGHMESVSALELADCHVAWFGGLAA